MPIRARRAPTNWERYDCIILEKYPGMLRPWELDELTLNEYAMLLEFDASQPEPQEGRGRAMSWEDIDREVKSYARLTPRQKLERAIARM